MYIEVGCAKAVLSGASSPTGHAIDFFDMFVDLVATCTAMIEFHNPDHGRPRTC